MHGTSSDRRALEREALRNVINQWNANRLDLFELSEPNEDLEFHGVMRFYFQDAGQKVATKCIRVASDATVEDVIGTLVEKFRPDMRMLSVPSYALYELHEGCPERRMSPDEKPLLVQLNWHVDDREGRFLLKNIDDKTVNAVCTLDTRNNVSFRRKLSKREKKQLKKQEKLSRMKSENGGGGGGGLGGGGTGQDENDDGVAEKLYHELPETSFTRSISNPEAVMRRRRQQKLEQKLQQFRSKDGGPDTGGTLKIYGEALCKDVPYKTLLLSVRDCAGAVVREMLDKYGLNKTDPSQWCLVQVTQQPGQPDVEYVLDDDECPLSILMTSPNTGSIMFHVRRRPADCAPRKRKKKPGVLGTNATNPREGRQDAAVPFLVELGPDGSVPHLADTSKVIRLTGDVMEVGSSNGIALQLYGPHIQPSHCVITTADGVTSLTPCHADAHTYINGQRIHQTTILQHGALIKFGHSNAYRFFDPGQEDRIRIGGGGGGGTAADSRLYDSRSPRALSPTEVSRDNIETTFDLEGNVETVSTASGAREDSRSLGSTSENRLSGMDRYPRGQDPILPAVLEFPEEPQEQFLARVITHLDVTTPTFRLAPAYTLYLCARYRASTHYRPELTPTERAHKLTVLLQHAAMLIRHTIQDRSTEVTSQAFWLANSSELLHFLKSDRHVSAFSLQAQDTLADGVQLSFKNLLACLTDELNTAMLQLMAMTDDEHPRDVIGVLSGAMNLLRKCRVNAALTIQLFSQLFHWISAKALAHVITNPALCTRAFGGRLGARLRNLQAWSETQGLELAAECHLAKIVQCCHLLQAPKYSPEDLANLSSACFKLNSMQLGTLLRQYKPEMGEKLAPPSLLDQAAKAAESVADELARAEGRDVTLYEDPAPPTQLLLPDDGFSCDIVQGVPAGLADFLHPLQASGLCRLAAQPTSSGHWTVYMSPAPRPPSAMSGTQPEVQMIRLHKAGGGMGLSIVAAKGAGQERLGIYIKSVVPGGAADRDGRLAAGDQLLAVDGQSLLGITQEKAAEFLVRTGSVVTLEVAKGGAVYHGLATLLQQPSPTPHRGPRRMSERDLPSRVDSEQQQHQQRTTIPSSKSVPALHHIAPLMNNNSNNELPPLHQHHHQQQQQIPTRNTNSNQHDVFNPGYSRTSSNNSINQTTLANNNIGNNGNPAAMRSRSTHNLYQQQQQQQQDGFYQNLSVYRNKIPSPQHLGDRTSALRSSQNSLQSTTTSATAAQRPSSAYYPPQLATNVVPRLNLHQSIPNLKSPVGHHRLQNDSYPTISNNSSYHHTNTPPYQQQQNYSTSNISAQQQQNYSSNTSYPSPVHSSTPNYPQNGSLVDFNRQYEMRSSKSEDMLKYPSQNDMMRYASSGNIRSLESSKVEIPLYRMKDEDLVRKQRPNYQTHQPNYPQQQQQQYYNAQMAHNMQNLTLNNNHHHQYYQNQYYSGNPQGPQSPKSPPVAPKPKHHFPEPPPVTTHPLYAASSQDLPKMAFYQTASGGGNVTKTPRDPWLREEQEKQEQARREASRQWQEHQIRELMALPHRTQQQEEQLRVLQLEREFQRRAMEAAEQDDDDTEKESPSPSMPQTPKVETPTSILKPGGLLSTIVQQQQQQQHHHQQQQQLQMAAAAAASANLVAQQNLAEQQVAVPAPPERGSSFAVMSMRVKDQGNTKRVSFDTSSPAAQVQQMQMVQQQQQQQPPNTLQLEESVREDPNSFIRQAESMLASPTTPTDGAAALMTATPGVIGAQEVYRDPRARRLAEQAQQKQTAVPAVPEKLSFKEKMKMFAMETGEQETPKDKSKISRAQREIDNIGSPPSSGMVH